MKYRKLGATGLKVSEIGFGTWQLANDPNMWVGADTAESLRALHRYAELGGNFIDTAWTYGWDSRKPSEHPSEALIGKFLKEYKKRDKIIVATKIPPKNFLWPARQGISIGEVFPPEHIVRCVEDSLRSLNVDSLDLVQFHAWQDYFADDTDWQDTVKRLKKEGKVKHWGLSINDYQPSNCLRTIDTGLIETIQCIFNIFHQLPADKLFPEAKEHKIGIIARVPLDEGGLTGTITRDTIFEPGDFRAQYFSGKRREELERRTTELAKLLGKEAKTLPELALRYILSYSAVSTVIPGMRKVAHVESNAKMSDGRQLSWGLFNDLEHHAWERNFYPNRDEALADIGYVEL